MNPFIEQLENLGYFRRGELNVARVQNATATEIIDLSSESADITSAEAVPRQTGAFTHSASLSLGGGAYPCAELECRVQRVKELSQFAALYSDKIYINNFLSDFSTHPRITTEAELDRCRSKLADHLAVILRLQPLIEAEKIIPVTAPQNWCPHCFRIRVEAIDDFDEHIVNRLATAGRRLRRRFINECRVTVTREPQGYALGIHGPKDLLEHGFHCITFEEIPPGLKALPEVRVLLARGREATLSRKQLSKLNVHRSETAGILENVLFELTVSQTFGTSFLTERPIHVEILASLTSTSQQERRNAVIQKHLTTLVPFLEGLEPAELLHIREQEADSFILFRRALNMAVDEATVRGKDFDARQARELYGDVIEPSLARLDLKLRSAQRTLVKSSIRRTSAWIGAISFGLISGILPSGLQAAAKIFGLTKVLADLGDLALATARDENAIRNEDLYFLWRVRESSWR